MGNRMVHGKVFWEMLCDLDETNVDSGRHLPVRTSATKQAQYSHPRLPARHQQLE